jgi:hypothetical protein
MVTMPPIASWKLILETTFAIKEDFSKNEATKWALRELKHRGLKWLFKPVASTAYERLVQSFYENLKYDCNQLDILVSFIDDRDIEVTIADITATLKCHDKPSEADEPWIVYPSMLTIEDIVYVVLQRNVCPSVHKTQRRDLFLSALYSFHKGFWCSIPEIIWRQIYKFWEGVHHRVVEPTRTWGLPFPFLITHILKKKGIKGNAIDGKSLSIHALGVSSGIKAVPTCPESH